MKNAAKLGAASPDFNNGVVHSHSALPGSGGSDLSSQSWRIATKEQERRSELSALGRANQAGARGGRADAALDAAEVDQEANTSKNSLSQSKKFLSLPHSHTHNYSHAAIARDNTPGAADPRYHHALHQTVIGAQHQRAKNNKVMHLQKFQEPVQGATNAQKSSEPNMVSHRLADQMAPHAADLVLIKNDAFNSQAVPSLIIKEKPHQSLALLMHLKKFSELLVAWGQSSKAIQVSKIISRAYALYESMNSSEHNHSTGMASSQNQQQIQSASARSTQ